MFGNLKKSMNMKKGENKSINQKQNFQSLKNTGIKIKNFLDGIKNRLSTAEEISEFSKDDPAVKMIQTGLQNEKYFKK